MSPEENAKRRRLDQYSLAAVPIRLFFNETELASATGFFWRTADKKYLITNWHNVTGKNPDTTAHLDNKTLAEPNRLFAHVQVNVPEFLGTKVPMQVPLRDLNEDPLWLVHPEYGRNVDVVAVPIEPTSQYDCRAINEMPSADIKAIVGADVFILGYPLGLPEHPSYSTPIWKRGSIASEPEMENDYRPILVDSASRRGMSGSPVILRSFGSYFDGKIVQAAGFGATRILGVYSGRVGSTDLLDAQLGRVWRISLVEEIVASQVMDRT
jgi:hypothetical protein